MAAGRTSSMTARTVLTRVIAGIPNLLSRTHDPNFIRDPDAFVEVRTPEEVADRIASVLPALLTAEGILLLELPDIEPDGYGGWSIRVPLSEQPWADGEVFLDRTGRIALAGIPLPLPVADSPAVAAALLAVYKAIDTLRAAPPP
ncbi:Uncharacterised protein [Mycobacteroides abscessus subsp. massiliense]|uniref:Uncharacterized protein n=2 Tax=Mycobacteroides abscessus TaxID=36809 RepID=A0A1U0VSB6_9MYCO|nr:Uncharacterised protein [Mycobacteroides abscessus subsp. massiliense]SKS91440.1 Uncharacterised protein [Mycobacteroides abscessus subsp. massiliense]SKT20423.1 Uncharacterised protein [Mycobacteroides abscessus subsp. massiliense]SKW83059.1 Uncharacterised protein [Mycobacteroides abscessus subsp. massiliense]